MNVRFTLVLILGLVLLIGSVVVYRALKAPQPRPVTDQTAQPPPPVTPPPAPPVDRPVAPETRLPPRHDLDVPLPPHTTADRILVEKKARRLTLFHNNTPLKSYQIALGRQPDGPKRFEGDHKTPEGHYTLDWRNPNSKFHRSLHISYPNAEDRAFAAEHRRSAGGAIMIHGLPNGWGALGPLHLRQDWTEGCIAVTNSEIEEIWRVTPDGVPIEIRP